MTDALDKEIADAFALLAVLVAFEFAFLAYLLSVLPAVVSGVDPLQPETDWKASIGRARHIEYWLTLLGVSTLLVLVVIGRLSWRVMTDWKWPWENQYVTSHGGVVLVDVFLVATVVVAGYSALATKGTLDGKASQRPAKQEA